MKTFVVELPRFWQTTSLYDNCFEHDYDDDNDDDDKDDDDDDNDDGAEENLYCWHP